MKLIELNGQKHVSFECPVVTGFDKKKYFNVNNLDGMYCLVLEQLRTSIKTKGSAAQRLNLKRRRLLIYIRRALRVYDNGRRLPLDVRIKCHNKKLAKLNGYTILG
jgi:hypothetical protein